MKMYINVRSGDYKLHICLDLICYLLNLLVCFSDSCILSGDVWDEVSTDK